MHAMSHETAIHSFESPRVIHEELVWRRRPGAGCSAASSRSVTISRWTDPATVRRRFTRVTESGYHTVGINLRETTVDFSVAGRTIHSGRVPSGALQISGPGDVVAAELSAPSDALRLYVPSRLLDECYESVHQRRFAGEIALIDPCFSRDPGIDHLARGLLAVEQMGSAHGGLCAEGLGLAIIARLLEAHSNCSQAPARSKAVGLVKWRLARAKDFIEANLEEPIHLADIAAATGLSRMHFAAQFRTATGLAPHEFVLRRRIARAQELLSVPSATLVDVALSVGFQTQAHFTTVFKRIVGQTPMRWRQHQHNARPEVAEDAFMPSPAILAGARAAEQGARPN